MDQNDINLEGVSRQAGDKFTQHARLGGAAALVPEAERLKRLHDARNMLRETMERWNDFMAWEGRLARKGEAEGSAGL